MRPKRKRDPGVPLSPFVYPAQLAQSNRYLRRKTNSFTRSVNEIQQLHPGAVAFVYIKPVGGDPRIVKSDNLPDTINSDMRYNVFKTYLDSCAKDTTKLMAERDNPLPDKFGWDDVLYSLNKKMDVDLQKMFFRAIKPLVKGICEAYVRFQIKNPGG